MATVLLKDATAAVRDRYRAARARAQQDLADAQRALAAAKARQVADTALLADTQKGIAATRALLAAAPVPPDVHELELALGVLQVAARKTAATLLDDGDAVAAAQAATDAAAGFLSALTPLLAAAEAAVAAASDDDDRRQRLRVAARTAPLDTLAADADALAAGDAATAEARIAAAFPPELVDAVDAAWTAEAGRRAGVADPRDVAARDLATERAAGSTGEKADAARDALAAAEGALRRWVEQARARYDRALAAVLAVNAGAALLSPAEQAAVDAAGGPGSPPGETAALARTDRESERQQLFAASLALDTAVQDARAAAPWADAAAIALEVAAATADLQAKQGDFDAAAAAYAPDAAAWGALTGSVGDPVWQKVADFRDAQDALVELGATGAAAVTALVDALDAAEDALGTALAADADHRLKLAYLERETAMRAALADRAAVARPARLLAAVRGDA
ncbi:MAG TPA: hypothetical protein VGO40_14010 [Longimicrobium sp.]|jgi:hypothetical protein|nr:hypothetical protein [Longimicrobium sp.]